MTRSKKCKKCKKCHKKRNHCAKIKVDKIEADIIEANEIRANKIILGGFPLSHPPIITQGFHDDSLAVEGNVKSVMETKPFPLDGVFPHPVAYNPEQVFLSNNIRGDTPFSELKGWKVDIVYKPVLINNSNKNIGMTCEMFLGLEGSTQSDRGVGFGGNPPYPGNSTGYENGSLLKGIKLAGTGGPEYALNFNEVTKKQQGTAGPSGVSELFFTGEIQNMFMGLYNWGVNGNHTSDVWYNPQTKKFLYIEPPADLVEIPSLPPSRGGYSTIVNLFNVIMQLTLDDPNDAQFLKIVVGDDGVNFDHNITITPVSFPEPR